MNQPARVERREPEGLVQNDENTYFVFENAPGEAKIALAYIADQYPNTKAKRVIELRVDRLTDRHNVICLVRGRDPRKPVTPLIGQRRSEHGIMQLVNADPNTLKGEICESEPIACNRYWNRMAGWEGGDGELDITGFLAAVGAAAAPLRVVWSPQSLPGIMKLGAI